MPANADGRRIERRFNALTNRERAAIRITLLLILAGLVFALGEISVRLQGRKPWVARTVRGMTIEPGGKLFMRHPTLGFTHIPGVFKVTFPDGYTYRATHLENGLRVTRPDAGTPSGKPGIWVFGCSFTYGMGLNDTETFPWLLQERFSDYEVVNFAQCGYGTVQALIQLSEAIAARGIPRVAVLTYASFHDERNTLLRHWRKAFFYYNTLGPLQQPYARLAKNGRLRIQLSSAAYRPFPFMRYSALIHCIEEKYDLLMERYVIHSHEVTKALIKEFARECASRKVSLVVAGIYRSPETADVLEFCHREGIPAIDIAVDYASDSRYNLLPHDVHPNIAAHRAYAEHLATYLSNVLGQAAAPL